MSNSRQQVNYGHAHIGIGITGYNLPKETYEPSKHNKAAPLRVGSQNAFNCPSLTPLGERKPYWGTTE